jgi:hypothetical protein
MCRRAATAKSNQRPCRRGRPGAVRRLRDRIGAAVGGQAVAESGKEAAIRPGPSGATGRRLKRIGARKRAFEPLSFAQSSGKPGLFATSAREPYGKVVKREHSSTFRRVPGSPRVVPFHVSKSHRGQIPPRASGARAATGTADTQGPRLLSAGPRRRPVATIPLAPSDVYRIVRGQH